MLYGELYKLYREGAIPNGYKKRLRYFLSRLGYAPIAITAIIKKIQKAC
jgi:hypothetical protein